MAFDSDTEASSPKISPLAIAGWSAAFGVSLLMLCVVSCYRLSAEFGMVALGFCGLVIALFVIDCKSRAAKRRMLALQHLAHRRGWHFLPDGHADVLSGIERFELGARGHAHLVSNLLSGTIDGVQFYVFDFGFMDGSGKGARYRRQTVVWLQREDARLPSFTVYPALFWWTRAHSLANDRRKIDMPGPHWFTRHYDVRSRDEQAMLDLLTGKVLSFFNGPLTLAVEGTGNHLVLCEKQSRLMKPEELSAFLKQSQWLYQNLTSSESRETE